MLGRRADAFAWGNSLRLGPAGLPWSMDVGTPRSDATPITDGPQLLAIASAKSQAAATKVLVIKKTYSESLYSSADVQSAS